MKGLTVMVEWSRVKEV